MSFWQGALIGLIVGFVLGFLTSTFFKKTPYTPEVFLAWLISLIWIFWNVLAGVGFDGITPPPTIFDIVAGGSVGFIMGEKFFDYVAKSIGGIFKK